jgi:hypothetical protein
MSIIRNIISVHVFITILKPKLKHQKGPKDGGIISLLCLMDFPDAPNLLPSKEIIQTRAHREQMEIGKIPEFSPKPICQRDGKPHFLSVHVFGW